MKKIIFLIVLIILLIGGLAALYLMPEDKIKEQIDNVSDKVNINIKITPTHLLDEQLKQLREGKFKEAQKHVNLNLSADLDDDYKEVYRLLYEKITYKVVSEDLENDKAVVKIKYPYIIDLINKQDQDDIEIVSKMKADIEADNLKYIEQEVELEVVNDHLVYNPGLFRALILLDVND